MAVVLGCEKKFLWRRVVGLFSLMVLSAFSECMAEKVSKDDVHL